MQCETCGVQAETRSVAFFCNIGMIYLRKQQQVEGWLCKHCIHHYFWKYTAINVFLGWWGIISFFCTIGFLLNNTIRYLLCLNMTPPLPHAHAESPDQLTDRVVAQLQPWAHHMVSRLQSGHSVEQVAQDYGTVANCSERQVILYLDALIAEQSRRTSR